MTADPKPALRRHTREQRRGLREQANASGGRWPWPLALVAAIAVAVYANSLRGALFYDDTHAIINNRWVRAGDPIAILTQASWWSEGYGSGWRPVTTLTFAVNYAVHGLDPIGYHLVNVTLHALVSVLVAAVFARVTGETAAAVIAGVLFAAHPIHTEAVASTVGRAELLAATGFFVAWWLFIAADGRRRAAAAGPPIAPSRARGPRPLLLEAAAVASFFSALLAKENAIALLPVLVLADLLYPQPGHTAGETLRRHAGRYGALLATVLVFVVWGAVFIGSNAFPAQRLDNPLIALPTAQAYATAIKVVALYTWRLAFPLHLSADYSFQQIAPVTSPIDAEFVAGLAILIGVPLGAWWLRRRAPAIALGLGFMLLTFAIVSNLVIRIGTIMAERLVYLPSAGFCLAVGAGLVQVAARGTQARSRSALQAAAAVTAVVLTLYAIRTWTRNEIWREPMVFFTAMVRDAPRSARSHRELGNVLADAGRFDESRRAFERSLAIMPEDAATLYNLGNAQLQAGQIPEAIEAYEHALAVKPNFADAMVNRGNAESMRGNHQAALHWMRKALVLTPRAAGLHMNVANELFHLGDVAEARTEYERASALAPDSADILSNFGAFLLAQGDYDTAISVYVRAADPPAPMPLVGLTASYRAKGLLAEARSTQARAERLFPESAAVRQMGQVLRGDHAGGAGSRP